MIKRKYRKQMLNNSDFISVKVQHKRFIKAIEMANNMFSSLFRVPEGYYECRSCKANKPFRPFAKDKYKNKSSKRYVNDEKFPFVYCATCGGTGYIDFVTNAMNNDKGSPKIKGMLLPSFIGNYNNLEIASIIFYLLYDKHEYIGLDINFKNPKKNKSKSKKINEFTDYFIEYKKERDKRMRFFKKNLKELINNFQFKIKIAKLDSNFNICTLCNFQPFDILYDEQLEHILLTVCGKCYGLGIQFARDSQPVVKKYGFPIENPNYSNKKKMLDSLLKNAHEDRRYLLLELSRVISEKDQLKKIAAKAKYL